MPFPESPGPPFILLARIIHLCGLRPDPRPEEPKTSEENRSQQYSSCCSEGVYSRLWGQGGPVPGWRGIREGFLEEAVNKQSLRSEQELPGEKEEELFIQMKPAHGCV